MNDKYHCESFIVDSRIYMIRYEITHLIARIEGNSKAHLSSLKDLNLIVDLNNPPSETCAHSLGS